MGLFGQAAQPVLRDADYRPVAMPTSDVHVLQVLTRQRRALRRYSDLATVLQVTGSPPPGLISDAQPVIDMNGAWLQTAKAGLGLGIVSGLLEALGAKADVKLSAAGARSVQYGYNHVTADRVDLALLDSWLDGAAFRPGLRNITELLVAEDVYVIVAVLKASSVQVRLLDGNDAGITVDVPAIEGIADAGLSVTAQHQGGTLLTFSGARPLTVAAKVARLRLDGQGFWVSERPVTTGEVRSFGSRPGGADYLGEPELALD